MAHRELDRRSFILAGAAAGTTGAAALGGFHDGELGAPGQDVRGGMPWREGLADSPPMSPLEGPYGFFTDAEAETIEAIVERLIPADPVGPGALEAAVPVFLDRQLSGPYGRGDHFYLGGPWPQGTPEQGYQSRLSPAQLYRTALAAIERQVAAVFGGATFAKLAPHDQDAFLRGLETGEVPLDVGVDGRTFFAMLLQNTKEGYLSDPIYGGNKDMAAWRMIGFPGAHYDYTEWVARHGERVPYPPVGLLGRPGWKEGA